MKAHLIVYTFTCLCGYVWVMKKYIFSRDKAENDRKVFQQSNVMSR